MYPGVELEWIRLSENDERWRRLGTLALGEVAREAPGSPPEGALVYWNGPHADFGLLDPKKSVWAEVAEADPALMPAGIGAEAQMGLEAALGQLGDEPEAAIVVGQGMLGHLSAQWLRLRGISVTVVENSPKRLEFSKYSGLTQKIDTHNMNWKERLARWNPEGTRLLVDACGHPKPIEALADILQPGGVLCRIGNWRPAAYSESVTDAVAKVGGAVVGPPPTFGMAEAHRALTAQWLALIAEGKIQTDRILTHHVTPDEAPMGMKRLAAGVRSWLGVVIDWTGNGTSAT